MFDFYKSNSHDVNINNRINGNVTVPDEIIFKRAGVFEGYAASLLAVKYMVDNFGEKYVLDLMYDNNKIRSIGETILIKVNE